MAKKLQRARPFSYEPTKPLRYVLYARKSSEGEDAQEKSIPDQIQYCEEYAERTELLVVKTVEEKKSAKLSGRREKFTQILEDIANDKYDGILAYHPDRLTRKLTRERYDSRYARQRHNQRLKVPDTALYE